ncbi:MAG: hypothetical protein A2Z04_02165 [Chloroflexi bacterium RBG_16_57_9]|nr:MAG: hypothetical protein A2Z04_02165 [Chloroflexi bacterium RBG_16_57_9]
MSTLREIEQAISWLSREDLARLREWFQEYDAKVWDRQFEDDAQSGKLDAVATQAVEEVNRFKQKMDSHMRPVSLSVRVEPPLTDPEIVERGRLLSSEIKRELAAHEAGEESLDDVMRRLRGEAWSPSSEDLAHCSNTR